MRLKPNLIILALVFALMGNAGSCGQKLPTVEQINIHLPKELRNCPHAPKSPGKGASKKRVGKYILGLYNAWEQCHGNVKDIDRLYKKWQNEVKKNNNGVCPITMVCD